MPQTILLQKTGPLASQVAEVLLKNGGVDLSRVEVWIPTAGAGRRIRRALAEQGVLSPRFTQPMRALLPAGVRIAERFEREGAWALALKKMGEAFLEPLFGDARLDSDAARLKSGGVLCDLCDLLAEAGWRPSDARVVEVCGEDAARWEVLAKVYQSYLTLLDACELTDPNEVRFAEMVLPSQVAGLDRLVIGCISDLPLVAQRYAEALEKLGVKVEVLVWFPSELSGGFDAWGRPIPEEWADCRLALDPTQIAVLRSPEDEARRALDFVAAARNLGDYAIVLADPTLGSAFCTEVESRGGSAFLPDGGRLDLTEAGVIALEWPQLQSTGELRILRRLLELPRFSRVLRGGSDLKSDEALAACDFLIGEAVLSDLDQAKAFAEVEFDPEKEKRRAQSQSLLKLVDVILPLSAPDLLAKAWAPGGEGLEAARHVVRLHDAISASPIYAAGGSRASGDKLSEENAFARSLKSEPVFDSSASGDVELSGWLEAPWIEAVRLSLCGCVEGCLPSSVNGHPFLPDSKRRPLGLADNSSRFARDAYLFQCLSFARSNEEFRASFSRFDAEGSPALPSSLFLRCGEDALSERVLELFGDLPSGKNRARRVNSWKWNLPERQRQKVVKISPTDFSDYLACPFRFYLKKVLKLDVFISDAREMDAKNFGILVHEALEKFGNANRNESDPAAIERLVLGHLDASVYQLFGPSPSPAVRVQVEAARVRLKGFARVQAEQYAKGWRIVSVERKLESEGKDPLDIGPLKLSGKIDRIECNESSGAWRVLDYKTYAKADSPAKKHFGTTLSAEWLPEAVFTYNSPRGPKPKRWKELQLPLYAKILRHWHGTEIGDSPVHTGYFVLSADPAATAIQEFTELDVEVMNSAMACAERIAALVHNGNFWPPQPLKTSWVDPFESLFLNGNPEACITPETIAFLKGNQ
jgi:ATP-dependent helicase/nuclease subunit B